MKTAEKIETEVVSYEEKALKEFTITPAEVAAKAKEFLVLKVKPDDATSYKTARSALTLCVSYRTTTDKRRKELGEDARNWVNAVNAAQKALIAPLAPAEEHLRNELQLEDGRRADIKAKKAAEEAARVQGIRAKIIALQGIPATLICKTAPELNAIFEKAFGEEITEAVYMEFTPEAVTAKETALDAISAAIEAREKFDREETERKVEAERLAKQKTEQEAEAARLAAEKKAQEEAAAKVRAEQEAEARRLADEKRKIQEERDRAEFEKQAKERAEAEARAKVEREEKERKEREERRIKEEAEQKVREAVERARQESLRPDKEKLIAYVDALFGLEFPLLQSNEARLILGDIRESLSEIVLSTKKRTEAL